MLVLLLLLRHNVPQMMLADLFGISQPTGWSSRVCA
ncbi:transposase family protein [Kribbella sp. NPDC058693]